MRRDCGDVVVVCVEWEEVRMCVEEGYITAFKIMECGTTCQVESLTVVTHVLNDDACVLASPEPSQKISCGPK